MSIKEDLRALVLLQTRELERVRISSEMAAVERERTALREQIAAAEAVVKQAEKDVEEARAAAKRLDIDLKAAEEKVSKYKDQMHSVKTNEQLWALQEEISHAEAAVGDVETKILEQLEVADSLESVISDKKAEMAREKSRIDAEIAEADRREKELAAAKAKVEGEIDDLSAEVPADLLKKYESIKALRGGIGVAEVFDETCLVCNTKVRPQHYVDTYNLVDIMQCENCKRIIYVAERVGLAGPSATAAKPPADLERSPEPAGENTPEPAAQVSAGADNAGVDIPS
ncbi:MAG: hypothetical protein PVJ51_04700 [Acidobacteriota bacterium]|jgi:predicted  nucleic acid-binding Zn-ribbon protein